MVDVHLVDVKVRGVNRETWRQARAYGLIMGLSVGTVLELALRAYLPVYQIEEESAKGSPRERARRLKQAEA